MTQLFVDVAGCNINFDVLDKFLIDDEKAKRRYSSLTLLEKDPNANGGKFQISRVNDDNTFVLATFSYLSVDDEKYLSITELKTGKVPYQTEESMLHFLGLPVGEG